MRDSKNTAILLQKITPCQKLQTRLYKYFQTIEIKKDLVYNIPDNLSEGILIMKKILIGISALLVLLCLASCSTEGIVTNIKTVTPECKNSEMQELYNYLKENKYINEQAVELEASYVGADEGYRFGASGFGNIELYFFSDKQKSSTDEGNIYASAKRGEVEIFGTKYKSAVSSDGNIVMLYASDVDTEKLQSPNLMTAVLMYPEKETSDTETSSSEASSK